MKVSIIGASGYAGGELLRFLSRHPRCDIGCVTSVPSEEGIDIAKVHPHLRGILKKKLEATDVKKVASSSELVFISTPHGVSMKLVPQLLEKGLKIIDLSGDFRFSDISTYERYYGKKHESPDIGAVYGLPELHRKEIKKARLVANPGCYPTSGILGLVPIVKEKTIDPEKIVIDSKSGVSGAGVRPSPAVHFCMVEESITPYKTTAHQHMPEIEQELRAYNKDVKVSFVPHLVPVIRGISSTLHCFLTKDINSKEIHDIYAKFYKNEPFVRVLDVGEIPRMSSVRGTNYIDIGGFEVDKERNRVVIIATIDNLVKGAAGQAIQNMNIMQGYEETLGLDYVGLHP